VILYLVIALSSGLNVVGIVSLLLICPIFLLEDEFVADVFKTYVFIFSISLIPSILSYVCVMILGIPLPNVRINSLNPDKVGDYFQYPFLVVYQQGGITMPNFFGYYDEPGVIGTISAILLIVRKFNLKEKINIPIFIAGLLSISFYFLLLFAIYILIFAKLKFKLVVAVIAIFFVTQYISNPLLYDLVFKRFELTSDGGFAGDNRISDKYFETWYRSYKQSSSYLFGLGRDMHLKYNPGGSSYVDIIIDRGILFFSVYVISFLLLGIKKLQLSKGLVVYAIVLLSLLYQRPFIENVFYVFLLFAPISALDVQQKQNLDHDEN
jgi:hypothetical protein